MSNIVKYRELALAPEVIQAPRDTNGPARLGLIGISIAVAGLLVWSMLAPLNSAIVASGSFIASSRNKIVQHFEGGIITAILVREGDVVEAGQPMLRLDKTAAEAMVARLNLKHITNRAMAARLLAESGEKKAVVFPASLSTKATGLGLSTVLSSQRIEFKNRRQKFTSEIGIYVQRREAIAQEIAGLKSQRRALGSQLKFIKRELRGIQKLYKRGYTTLPRLLALKRTKAQIQGNLGEFGAKIARAKVRMIEATSQITHIKSKVMAQTLEELRKIEVEHGDIKARLSASSDVLNRLEVRAPVRGVVVKLVQNTPGGVIASGQEILELLPVDDELVIEVKVKPQDIDIVKKGQLARVRLSALDQRTTPMIEGRVAYVSAGLLKSAGQQDAHYVARIRLDKNQTAKLQALTPSSGMPVEVFINTGGQTFMSYLMSPLLKSFSRAFREI